MTEVEFDWESVMGGVCMYSRVGGCGGCSGWQMSVLWLDHPQHAHLPLRASGGESRVGRRLCYGLVRGTAASPHGRLVGARIVEELDM